MKQSIYKIAVAVLALSTAMLPTSYAATQSATVPVSASVSSALTLTVNLFSVNAATFAESPVPAFNFGALFNNLSGGMGAGSYYKAYVNANSQGVPYVIVQNGTAVSNGTYNLPANACRVTPSYEPASSGGAAFVGTLGSAGSWVGTRTLYTSNPSGDTRTLSIYYGLVSDPAAGAGNFVPISQPAGNYSGTVVFTVTA